VAKKISPPKLSPRAKIELEEARADWERGRQLVRKARYKEAFLLAKKTLKRYPNNRFAIYRYAVTLGDSGSYVSSRQHAKNQAASAKLFRSLLKSVNGIDARWVIAFRNEYYWFSKQPYKQYRLGIDQVKTQGKSSLYSAGVGATSLSQKYYEQGKAKLGKLWAQKAIAAWKIFVTEIDDYYNAYVWYAKSLGLTGDLAGMEKYLRKAAKLANKPLSYKEFGTTRKDVEKALTRATVKSKKSR
jgi:hypothetical protein